MRRRYSELLALALLGAGATTALAQPTTERVSVRSNGAEGTQNSFGVAISETGQFVVFTSQAPRLVSGDFNGTSDVFRYNRPGDTIALVSVGMDGRSANGSSLTFWPAVSRAGRFVAFESDASNLVPGDTNMRTDIFVRDMQAGTTEIVSIASDGHQGNRDSRTPAISADGRQVAFYSEADNLDGSLSSGIFVYDRKAGLVERVSVASNGDLAAGSFGLPSLSSDGRYVSFDSDAANLVPSDTNGESDIFVRDRQLHTTTRVSIGSGGQQGNSVSNFSRLSADGRFVVFASAASNLVAGDTNEQADVFLRDRTAGTTSRLSVSSAGVQGNANSPNHGFAALSPDARFVAFQSFASNLVSGDTNNVSDIFVRDRQQGTTTRVSLTGLAGQSNGRSDVPAISADGRVIAFESDATNLVPGDTNGATDIFARDRGP